MDDDDDLVSLLYGLCIWKGSPALKKVRFEYCMVLLQPQVRIDLENPRGPIRDWVAQEPVQREISAQFKNFLRNYQDSSGDNIYRDRLREMCTSELSSCISKCLPDKAVLVVGTTYLVCNGN